jgi:hypothetical protein
MKSILHFLFIISIIFFMSLMILPAIAIYMFTQHNIMQDIQMEAARIELKYFS